MDRKLKKTAFIWNRTLKLYIFTVTSDEFKESLLNNPPPKKQKKTITTTLLNPSFLTDR